MYECIENPKRAIIPTIYQNYLNEKRKQIEKYEKDYCYYKNELKYDNKMLSQVLSFNPYSYTFDSYNRHNKLLILKTKKYFPNFLENEYYPEEKLNPEYLEMMRNKGTAERKE